MGKGRRHRGRGCTDVNGYFDHTIKETEMTTEAAHIPRFGFIIMETIEEVDGPQPVAGFNMEADVCEFVRVFEASEGYRPRVYELDSEEDVYHEVGVEKFSY